MAYPVEPDNTFIAWFIFYCSAVYITVVGAIWKLIKGCWRRILWWKSNRNSIFIAKGGI